MSYLNIKFGVKYGKMEINLGLDQALRQLKFNKICVRIHIYSIINLSINGVILHEKEPFSTCISKKNSSKDQPAVVVCCSQADLKG